AAVREPVAAVAVPALAFGRVERPGPVAGAVAEQQFGQARVAEAEVARAQQLRRRGADLGEAATVGVLEEAVVERAVRVGSGQLRLAGIHLAQLLRQRRTGGAQARGARQGDAG